MGDKISRLKPDPRYWQISVCKYPLADGQKFTYSSDICDLGIGKIVKVGFGRSVSLGVVYGADASRNQSFKVSPLSEVLDLPSLPSHLLKVADWLQAYYAASAQSTWQTVLPSKLDRNSRLKPFVATKTSNFKPNRLSLAQNEVLGCIANSKQHKFLLHGVTGSGKTEVFLHLIDDCLRAGQSAILLVPEIMLTTQMIDRVSQHFSGVVVLHSGLSPAQRRANWRYLLDNSPNKPLVVLGTRSAIFAPLFNLGLIIIDEEHEPSYKQDSSPRYNTAAVAAKIANDTGAKLILASATPSVSSYFLARVGKLKLLTLNDRYQRHSGLPQTAVVKLDSSKQLITSELKAGLQKTLGEKKQALLFLNLRGSARSLICTDCGQSIKCPRCEISLSFHADKAKLLCHYCGYSVTPPAKCPSCGHHELSFVGAGTKQLETNLATMFPLAKIVRVDRDSANPEFLQTTYRNFRDGRIDILIGTQMISRGLDIPFLHLVGIINANTSLSIADFSASERTFQLTAQAAGRAGRRKQIGEVVIQTFSPDNPAIAAAAKHDYAGFYNAEIEKRRQFNYPPFVYLLKLTCTRKGDAAAQQAATIFKNQISSPGLVVLGPTPAYQKSLAGKSRWQLVVKARNRSKLVAIAHNLPSGWTADLDPINLL
ncbi:primosomal protein N' [Candidatus Saccharibacteria bacterium]|nr:primosomal protein N' [Candidatus Saccharibacteria bacterium]